MSPPNSTVTLSPPTTPLTPEPGMTGMKFPLLTDNNNLGMSASTAANTLLLQQQYHYQRLLLQQQQQQLALAQHQLALAASAAAVNHHQKDEISHSLKMFALLTACNAESNSSTTQDAMQEFASNGYISDDLNRMQNTNAQMSPPLPLAYQAPAPPAASATTVIGNTTGTANAMPPSVAAAHWINLNNYREQLNNVWRNISYMPMSNMAANAGIAMAAANHLNSLGLAGVQADHMRNVNNKMPRRYNNGKPKDMVQRRCVFCENNNEPEAVVNSHSVRDSYGRVLCPKLRTYVCPICGASGDSAHTIKYCPKKPIVTMEDAIKAESFRLSKTNYYKQQMKV
ncbi:nos [Drosophila busckii]|uniref:Nos n=1 Tax=Drosophila busckii TaxID=30019 RepID=A0A0M5J0F4_DROBS|nr:nos [Drosophila busckii]